MHKKIPCKREECTKESVAPWALLAAMDAARAAESLASIAVHVQLCDGRSHSFQMRTTDSVGVVRQKLSSVTGLPRAAICVASGGETRSDSCLLETCRSKHDAEDASAVSFLAWTERYSAHRSTRAHAAVLEAAAARERQAQERADVWGRVREAAAQVPSRTWAKIGGWVILSRVAKHLGFGAPFFIASLIWLMLTNLGERKPGESSAYTVFNQGRALPGQLRQEDFERELLHQHQD